VDEEFFIQLPMKMELIEGPEASAFRTQTPGNYPKENKPHKEHGESLKSRNGLLFSTYHNDAQSNIHKFEKLFKAMTTRIT
jgi:hypothetical protein